MEGGRLTAINWISNAIKRESRVVKTKDCSIVQRLVDSTVSESCSIGSVIEPSVVSEGDVRTHKRTHIHRNARTRTQNRTRTIKLTLRDQYLNRTQLHQLHH
jgi:hypothetical protein